MPDIGSWFLPRVGTLGVEGGALPSQGVRDETVAEVAFRLRLASREQIEDALKRMSEAAEVDLAGNLVALGVVTADQAQGLRELASVMLPGRPVTGVGTETPQLAGADAPTRESGPAPTTPMDPISGTPWGMLASELPSARYTLREEIGRGGLGRVVEAVDHVFNRTVALKLLAQDSEKAAQERFRFEAMITGRLDHPHIVAVHDMGMLAGSRDSFYSMKRIQGEDLSKIIARRSWPQRRLIEAFRDICLAIAYAHSRGVIHRDLKPANVMLGEYGEVFVVDWGLARSMHLEAPGEARPFPSTTGSPDPARLTMAGAIIGTPQYMSPEQATGRIDAVDERSDVYGLGGILYQILCGKAPFESDDFRDVLKKVVSDPPAPPSLSAEVDPQLEAICLKALEKDPKARFPGARALANEVDAYLEGARDLERRSEIAQKHLADAERILGTWRQLMEDWRKARLEPGRSRESLGGREDIDSLRSVWRQEDKIESLARRGMELFHEADLKFGAALSVVPGHQLARRMRASLYWERFLVAEEEKDERAMLSARQTLETLDDGTYSSQVRGEGTISLETLAWRCPCLNEGRRVGDGEVSVWGHDPATGRKLGRSAAGHPRFLRVHGRACPRVPSPGAEVWLYRNLETDRILVPVGDGVGGPGAPDIAIRRLYGESAYRPRGAGLFIGKTPIRDLRVPMGSGVLLVVAAGRDPAIVPFRIGRGERLQIALTLFASGESPDSARFVPRPPMRSGDLHAGAPAVDSTAFDDDFFVERFPVTCREYAAFLNSLVESSPREAMKRVPRAAESSDFYWLEDSKGRFSLPGSPGKPGDLSCPSGNVSWRDDWPVVGVSWDDAMAYARWKTEKEGRLWCLLPEALWQRAAQGDDRRPFPWGERRISSFSHNLESAQGQQRPEPVGARPCDESPFGIRDMAGNVSEWCLDDIEEVGAGLKLARGGNWSTSHASVDCTTRLVGRWDLVHPTIGFRICTPACLSGEPKKSVGFGA